MHFLFIINDKKKEKMEDTKQFKKNFIWNILGTGFNAFNSLFFLITVTRINGLNDAGIFTIAYSTACIIFVFGIYAGRIYQVTEPDKKVLNIDYVVNRVITVLLMSFFVIIFSLVRGYDNYKTLVFFFLTLYKSLEAFSEVIYGILQKKRKVRICWKIFIHESKYFSYSFYNSRLNYKKHDSVYTFNNFGLANSILGI